MDYREYIVGILEENKDEEYGKFQSKLIPTVDSSTIIGVRTPVLREIAREINKNEKIRSFLGALPHTYFEENQLHSFVISKEPDFCRCIEKVEEFLPYIDNWATCDQLLPKVFKKHGEELVPYIIKWLASEHTYTVRFAIGMLMRQYLDEHFRPEYLELVTAVKTEEYYINMEIAWYMATALAKQWDYTIPYIEEARLDKWVHNKTIQKARESRRITSEQKEYLKSLKI